MKKLSLTLALLCLLASFAFAEVVCKNGKLFFKEGDNFYPAVYEYGLGGSVSFNFYDEGGNQKDVVEGNDIKIIRTCPELKQKLKYSEQKHKSNKKQK